jgi:PST family polysaccharide transporter
LSLIPNFIAKKIATQPEFKKILDNIGWQFFDKAFRVAIGLFVSVWFARYLGPEKFGIFNYAIAFITLANTISSLGLKDIIIRELVQKPENTHAVLGTSFVMLFASGIASWVTIVFIVNFLYTSDLVVQSLIVIIGITLIINAKNPIRYLFESKVDLPKIIWIESCFFFISSLVKITLIVAEAPILPFAILMAFESIAIAICFILLYQRSSTFNSKLRFEKDTAVKLLSDSWPLMISSVSVMIYMRIDQIMIGNMIGASAVGVYSASLRVSELWHIIPVIICSSVFPSILRAKQQNVALYNVRIQKLLNFLATISIVIAIIITFTASWIIESLYGNSYSEAASILTLHIWCGIFVFIGVAGSKWYLAEDLQKLILYRSVCAAIVNVILNFYLIPIYGNVGAAIATLISMALSGYILDTIAPQPRILFYAKTKAIFYGLFFVPKYLVLAIRSEPKSNNKN